MKSTGGRRREEGGGIPKGAGAGRNRKRVFATLYNISQ